VALVTAAQVRTWLPAITGTNEDTTLGTLATAAGADLAAAMFYPREDGGTHTLATATYTVYLEGPRDRYPRELLLPMRPVVSITSVHQSVTDTYGASELVASTDYIEELARGVLVAKQSNSFGGWSSDYRGQKVIMAAGWGTSGNGPEWLQQAVAYQVQHTMKQRAHQGVTQRSQGGASKTDQGLTRGIDSRAWALVAPHALWERGIA